MNQFEYLINGTYLALFLAPVIAFILRERLVRFDNHILIACALAVSFVYLSFKLGWSFHGVMADVTVIFFLYVFFTVGSVKLINNKNSLLKVVGLIFSVAIVLIAFFSVPAFLGVAIAVAEFETEYETLDEHGYVCRVSSYGNATTSTGGYNASVFRVLGPFEKKIDFESVESTRRPEITPETVCRLALSNRSGRSL